jgi:formylmethanofuran dehydrogenase subunit B
MFSDGRFQESSWNRYVTSSRVRQIQKRSQRVSKIAKGVPEIQPITPTKEITHSLPPTLLQKRRKMIVVDVRKTRTADVADFFLQVQPNSDYEILQALRMLVRGEYPDIEEVAGIPVELLEDFVDLLINCELGALFFGLGLTMSTGKHRNIDAALNLIRDLNRRTKFLIMPMRGHFNVTGANIVSTWQTGYPFAVDFSKGYPQYNPGETSAVDILSRGDSDAALVIASDPVSNFPKAAVHHLVSKPLIVIDPIETPTTVVADVVLPSTFIGMEIEGTVYRMDHVPLPLKKVVDPPQHLLSDEIILQKILQQVRRLK